jgi:hypothetical protein
MCSLNMSITTWELCKAMGFGKPVVIRIIYEIWYCHLLKDLFLDEVTHFLEPLKHNLCIAQG